ncbi:MAG: hypothetical protein JW861_00050 [Bacteroidales bacterium]|nr:hypothetical protein [Bacteroidales bacterium]
MWYLLPVSGQNGIPFGDILLPTGAGNWTSSGEPRFYQSRKLYDLMNGAADIFQEYGCEEACVMEFFHPSGKSIKAEVYRMHDAPGAFGVYTFHRTDYAKPAGVGQDGQMSSTYLIFWKDRYFISLTGAEENIAVSAGIRQISDEFAKSIHQLGEIPRILRYLPQDLSLCYIRGIIGLRNTYPFPEAPLFDFIEGGIAVTDDYFLCLLRFSGPSDVLIRLRQTIEKTLLAPRFMSVSDNQTEMSYTDLKNNIIKFRQFQQFVLILVAHSETTAARSHDFFTGIEHKIFADFPDQLAGCPDCPAFRAISGIPTNNEKNECVIHLLNPPSWADHANAIEWKYQGGHDTIPCCRAWLLDSPEDAYGFMSWYDFLTGRLNAVNTRYLSYVSGRIFITCSASFVIQDECHLLDCIEDALQVIYPGEPKIPFMESLMDNSMTGSTAKLYFPRTFPGLEEWLPWLPDVDIPGAARWFDGKVSLCLEFPDLEAAQNVLDQLLKENGMAGKTSDESKFVILSNHSGIFAAGITGRFLLLFTGMDVFSAETKFQAFIRSLQGSLKQ